MKTKLFLVSIFFCVFLIACKQDQPTFLNNNERILTVSYRYRFEPCYGCGYSDTKLIFDSTQVIYQKRLGWDSTMQRLPDIDSTLYVTSQIWFKIITSFNMDSVISADTLYPRIFGEEPEETIEIYSTSRSKKIIFHGTNLIWYDPNSSLGCIDSLRKILYNLRWREL